MWSTGQAWRVVNGLNKLRDQIRAYAPRAVPPATDFKSWGSIADDAHSASSDHYPHYYAELGSTAVVCARDFPHAPTLGLDGGVVTEHMRQARDGRVKYIISNRRITGPGYGWQWATYTGDDPHDTHFHVSSVHTAAADGTQAWSLPGAAAASSPTGGSLMAGMVVRFDGNSAVFVTDHVQARWLKQMADKDYLFLLAQGGWTEITNVKRSPNAPEICQLPVAQLGILGTIVGDVPPNWPPA